MKIIPDFISVKYKIHIILCCYKTHTCYVFKANTCLQGLSGKKVREEVDSMIEDLQLTDKANQKSAALSGGQKRKLR